MEQREVADEELRDILMRSLPSDLYFQYRSIEDSFKNLAIQLDNIDVCRLDGILCPVDCPKIIGCERMARMKQPTPLEEMIITKINKAAKELVATKRIQEGRDWLEIKI